MFEKVQTVELAAAPQPSRAVPPVGTWPRSPRCTQAVGSAAVLTRCSWRLMLCLMCGVGRFKTTVQSAWLPCVEACLFRVYQKKAEVWREQMLPLLPTAALMGHAHRRATALPQLCVPADGW